MLPDVPLSEGFLDLDSYLEAMPSLAIIFWLCIIHNKSYSKQILYDNMPSWAIIIDTIPPASGEAPDGTGLGKGDFQRLQGTGFRSSCITFGHTYQSCEVLLQIGLFLRGFLCKRTKLDQFSKSQKACKEKVLPEKKKEKKGGSGSWPLPFLM